MAEPKRDHGRVDARLEEPHRGGVAQHMQRYPLLRERRTAGQVSCDVFGEAVLERVAAEPGAAAGGEQRAVWVPVAFT
jgi:hypothetical protein